MTKKLTALFLCALMLCAAPLALASGVDTSLFSKEKAFEWGDDGDWEYSPVIGVNYSDGWVRVQFDVRGGDGWAYAPRLILSVFKPNSKSNERAFIATGLDMAVDDATYAFRKMENVNGSGLVHLYENGRKIVQAFAKAKKIVMTFRCSGFTNKYTLTDSQLADIKKAAQLMLDANVWDYIPSELEEVYEEKERDYPLQVFNVKK